jgi:hypothetical protein
MCVLLQSCCDKWKKNCVPAQHTAHRNPVHQDYYVALGFNLHTLFTKMMFALTDTIISKETSQGAGQLLEAMFETCLEKLKGLCVIQSEVSTTLESNKQTSKEIMNIVPNASFIEKQGQLVEPLMQLRKHN